MGYTYRIEIDNTALETLKKWNAMDPISEKERNRAEMVVRLGGIVIPIFSRTDEALKQYSTKKFQ